MRIVRIGAALIILIAAVAFAVGQAGSLRTFFQVNKARYLANQQKWEEARSTLDRALSRDPDSHSARRLYGRIALNTGDLKRAQTELTALPTSAETLLELGLVEYQLGDEAAAARYFDALTTAPDGLSAARRTLGGLAADELAFSQETVEAPLPDQDLHGLERMLYDALTGRALLRTGRFDEAKQKLESAMDLGDLNQRTRVFACVAAAGLGDFSDAQRLVDYAGNPAACLDGVTSEALAAADLVDTQSVSLIRSARTAEWLDQLKLATTWAALRKGVTGSSESLKMALAMADEMSTGSTANLEARILRAEALEAMGDLADAYAQYMDLMRTSPSYAVYLRARDLAGESVDAPSTGSEMLGSRSVVTCTSNRDYVSLFKNGTDDAVLHVPASGRYMLDIVARGDTAQSLSPLANVLVDGRKVGQIYVSRDGWDCYPVAVTLAEGPHQFSVEYVNDSERSGSEDRNLYVLGLILSQAGVR